MKGEGHRSIREELGGYALGQLSGERWRVVHEHLEVCAACRAELEEIAPVAGMLSAARDRLRPDDVSAEPEQAPPLPDELIAEVRAAAPAPTIERRPPPPRLLLAAAAVGVVLAGGLGFALGAGGGSPIPTEQIAVRALDPDVTAEADLVPHTWGMEVQLTASGFTPGAAYVVTVTDDAGRTVGAGEFLGTGPREMRCNLNSSVLRADAALVQVTAPDGEVVLDARV